MSPPRRRWLAAGLALACLAVLAACDPSNPRPEQVVPGGWGAELGAAQRDVPYLAGADRGCGAGAASHDRCGGSQTLDVYLPVGGGNRGTLVFVHGGGFSGGDKRDLNFGDFGVIKRQLARGWGIVSVNYRLAQGGVDLFPAGIRDVIAATAWVAANGGDRGLNTDRLVVVGHSAGGTLAALAGTAANSGRPEYAGIPTLSGWMSIAGIMDYEAGNYSRLWGRAWMEGSYPAQRNLAAPLTWWDPTDPTGYVVHGDLDEFVEYENARRLQAKVGASPRVRFDIVDRYNDGTPLPTPWRGHMPTYGMHSPNLDAWLDGVPSVAFDRDPFGSLDLARAAGAGAIRAAGWTIDPDTGGAIRVHFYVDGRYVRAATASRARPDVGRAFPAFGSDHGFDVTLTGMRPGARQVCAYAINVARGTTNPQLGCRTVVVP